jgi:hypothetical protein
MSEPDSRWLSFGAYLNEDGTWYLIVTDEGGGRQFADQIISQHDAEWAADALNAALHAKDKEEGLDAHMPP